MDKTMRYWGESDAGEALDRPDRWRHSPADQDAERDADIGWMGAGYGHLLVDEVVSFERPNESLQTDVASSEPQ